MYEKGTNCCLTLRRIIECARWLHYDQQFLGKNTVKEKKRESFRNFDFSKNDAFEKKVHRDELLLLYITSSHQVIDDSLNDSTPINGSQKICYKNITY